MATKYIIPQKTDLWAHYCQQDFNIVGTENMIDSFTYTGPLFAWAPFGVEAFDWLDVEGSDVWLAEADAVVDSAVVCWGVAECGTGSEHFGSCNM